MQLQCSRLTETKENEIEQTKNPKQDTKENPQDFISSLSKVMLCN
jgi:hypothetical protein